MVDFAFSNPYDGTTVNLAMVLPSAVLHVSGDQLLDASNNSVLRLPSINISDWQNGINTQHSHGIPSFFTQSDVQHIASHGGKIMEVLEIYWDDIEPQQNVYDQTELALLDNLLAWAQASKVYCLLCFQDLSNPWTTLPTWVTGGTEHSVFELGMFDLNDHAYDSARIAFRNFMAYIVNRYKNNDYFLLDFFNEPLNGNHIDYDDVKVSADYAHFIEWMYDEVMAAGYRNPLIVDHPWCNFAHPSQIMPVNRPNIIWEFHMYTVIGTRTVEEWKTWVDNYISKYHTEFGKPVYMGEYGYLDYSMPSLQRNTLPNWQAITQEMVNYAKTKPIIGYSWLAHSSLYGEYYDYAAYKGWYGDGGGYHLFTEAESEWILQTVVG